MKHHLNTYTFAKNLTENIIKKRFFGKIDIAIVRPSGIGSTLAGEWEGGWDNAGKVWLYYHQKKVQKIVAGHKDHIFDVVPCDIVTTIMRNALYSSKGWSIIHAVTGASEAKSTVDWIKLTRNKKALVLKQPNLRKCLHLAIENIPLWCLGKFGIASPKVGKYYWQFQKYTDKIFDKDWRFKKSEHVPNFSYEDYMKKCIASIDFD